MRELCRDIRKKFETPRCEEERLVEERREHFCPSGINITTAFRYDTGAAISSITTPDEEGHKKRKVICEDEAYGNAERSGASTPMESAPRIFTPMSEDDGQDVSAEDEMDFRVPSPWQATGAEFSTDALMRWLFYGLRLQSSVLSSTYDGGTDAPSPVQDFKDANSRTAGSINNNTSPPNPGGDSSSLEIPSSGTEGRPF
ncbi:hypothetical protein B0T16DRAFT_457172 [Cercophora newfieldiana]|uniref:Uncharacterized protein n=1 Tax=Cercophora newfieldiana TaxID=92897 RepID=A0AA39YDB6_9PEZI|nr:hypothetical protein B0T16DRAFT_457172 [Cercophora newfieldiana]